MKTYQKSKLSSLKMVFPPMSNQEAIWVEQDNHNYSKNLIKQSDFYMICGKKRGTFECNLESIENTNKLEFNIRIDDIIVSTGKIDFLNLPCLEGIDDYKIGISKNFIQISTLDDITIDRFSPENILWHRSRYASGILGLDNYKELLEFDLLYVGIAKVGDSYSRLIEKGHKARMKILSNEPQRTEGSRVADEIFLFFFIVDPLVFTTYDDNHDFTEEDIYPTIDLKRVVADAEKAFVNLLKPEYNIIKFKEYPKGADGLYSSDYDRYGYTIAESIIFNTPHGKIIGDYTPYGISNYSDTIFIEGAKVEILYMSKS